MKALREREGAKAWTAAQADVNQCTAVVVRVAMTMPVGRSLLTLALFGAYAASPLTATEPSQAVLRQEAKVPQAQAERTALAQVPGGTIKSSELEKEHGKLIWSFDIAMPKSRNITEVQVDAKTGKVVSTQIETPADQAKEAAGEQKVKK